jgi:chitin disaccharide deacetylase
MKKTLTVILATIFSIANYSQEKNLAERLGYPKDAKLVIIHSDDLGVSHSENAASIMAIEKGSVSSASIMVPCPWFSEIAAYAQAHPAADLGLHITLTSQYKYYKWGPVTSIDKVPGLVNKNGYFYSTVDSVIQNASAAEVEQEIRNQVIKGKQMGIDPTHLDAHMGTALSNLDFFKAYLKVGHEFKIPVLITSFFAPGLKTKLDSLITDKDVVVDNILSSSPGDLKTGFPAFYTQGIKNLKPGLTYLIIHTAYDNDETRAIEGDQPDWGAAWRQAEFDFFTSPECAKVLKENNVYVITWKEIRDKITRK